jgi:hypothetical protein
VLDHHRRVGVQWDPERSVHLRPLPWRSLQLGLSGSAAERYADEWITAIVDVTPLAREIRARLAAGGDVSALLPEERPYPLPDRTRKAIGVQGPGFRRRYGKGRPGDRRLRRKRNAAQPANVSRTPAPIGTAIDVPPPVGGATAAAVTAGLAGSASMNV